jgi:tetratricopeptide (TPR) repeat protein
MVEDDPSGRGLDLVEPAPGFQHDDGADPLLDRLSRVCSNLDRERAAAPGLVAELLSLSPGRCAERLQADARYQTWGVCELLLARSAEAADPDEAGRLAGLTLTGAERLDPARHAASVVEDLKARAWAIAGDVYRRQGELAEAEAALRAAAACLANGTGDLLVDAHLLEFEAALRREQGRIGEAAALLKLAAARYREAGEMQLFERALAAREAMLRQERPMP